MNPDHKDYMRQVTVDVRGELIQAIQDRRKTDRASKVNVRRQWADAMQDAVMEELPYGPDEF